MSNYYEKREAKVNIAHALMANEWTVYGYKPDRSDSMTDYYDPAYWEGIATKNDYVLCVDIYGTGNSGQITYEYTHESTAETSSIHDKINLLRNMTMERGASAQEEETAKAKIKLLEQKINDIDETREESKKIKEQYPVFQENPPHCIWHIEKDGNIIAKGRALTKYADMPYWWDYSEKKLMRGDSLTEEEQKQVKAFYAFIDKLENTVNIKIGNGVEAKYKKITKTEYKTEMKAFDYTGITCEKDIQILINKGHDLYFKLNINFNYGCYKGLIYKIRLTNYSIEGTKLNGKLTKLCTGLASSNNRFSMSPDKFFKYVENGAIGFVELKEIKTPYQVEKFVLDNDTKSDKDEAEQSCNKLKAEISINKDRGGIEIAFSGKPCSSIIETLKENSFRWHYVNQYWYAKDSINVRQFVLNELSDKIGIENLQEIYV